MAKQVKAAFFIHGPTVVNVFVSALSTYRNIILGPEAESAALCLVK